MLGMLKLYDDSEVIDLTPKELMLLDYVITNINPLLGKIEYSLDDAIYDLLVGPIPVNKISGFEDLFMWEGYVTLDPAEYPVLFNIMDSVNFALKNGTKSLGFLNLFEGPKMSLEFTGLGMHGIIRDLSFSVYNTGMYSYVYKDGESGAVVNEEASDSLFSIFDTYTIKDRPITKIGKELSALFLWSFIASGEYHLRLNSSESLITVNSRNRFEIRFENNKVLADFLQVEDSVISLKVTFDKNSVIVYHPNRMFYLEYDKAYTKELLRSFGNINLKEDIEFICKVINREAPYYIICAILYMINANVSPNSIKASLENSKQFKYPYHVKITGGEASNSKD